MVYENAFKKTVMLSALSLGISMGIVALFTESYSQTQPTGLAINAVENVGSSWMVIVLGMILAGLIIAGCLYVLKVEAPRDE